jgi:ribosomal-protein-alanine N-acetyltransferase
VTNGKPAPDLFLLAAQRLGIDPATCLVLEDAEPGVIAAHRAGMQVYMVPDLQPSSPTTERLANGIFDSLNVVARHLELTALGSRRPIELFNTDRLIAVPLCAGDLQELCLMHQDAEVMKYMNGVRDEEGTKRWLSENLAHWDAHGFGCWMFSDKANGRFVGRALLRHARPDNADEVEVGYALVTRYWGMGLATEMAKAMVEIGFERLKRESLIALVIPANVGSQKVAERIGFRFERNTIWKFVPVMLFRLERGQWLPR